MQHFSCIFTMFLSSKADKNRNRAFVGQNNSWIQFENRSRTRDKHSTPREESAREPCARNHAHTKQIAADVHIKIRADANVCISPAYVGNVQPSKLMNHCCSIYPTAACLCAAATVRSCTSCIVLASWHHQRTWCHSGEKA